MHAHHLGPTDVVADPRFADDDFTRDALAERAHFDHAHRALHGLLALLGGLLLFGMVARRRCY